MGSKHGNTPFAESVFKLCHAGGRNEQESGIQWRFLDGFSALHINVQDADLSLIGDTIHCIATGSIHAGMHFGIF